MKHLLKKSLTAAISVAALAAPMAEAGYTETKYPIVLVHGIAGFDSVAGIVGYFHTIPYNLKRSGATVHVASVSAFESSEVRGAQLANQIVPWANAQGGKVNLMGHSQGAPTSRVALTLKPNKIASITSIDGVNKGSKVADVIRGVIPASGAIEGGAAALANAFGTIVNWLSGANNQQNAINALWTLTTPGTNELNETHGWGVDTNNYCGSGSENVTVNGNPVKLYSWSGKSSFTNVLDILDPAQAVLGLAFVGQDVSTSDGLVDICSSKMGKVIGTHYDMNHMDAVNHTLGIRSLWHDPVSQYRAQANRLKNNGL
ncbi:esterase/lipase family protein [Litoribrevibacter albus]|uniref:Lactonizing lipase n=1 Tax=Litoribrevibacter albus TaxID=1473156 RepID=A0AA37W6H4_9GAMM|nr:alpha/beta fold hydrolase [Litoribrevibacter albus]GLQ32022.1 lactonizing lipase [Litoribrevibacter albus]